MKFKRSSSHLSKELSKLQKYPSMQLDDDPESDDEGYCPLALIKCFRKNIKRNKYINNKPTCFVI